MKAAVVHDFTKSLSVEERPKPVPGAGEVLVRVETAGLCHTDIHAAHGDWPVKPTPPFIPGHEGVGIVEQVGSGVTTPRVAAPRPIGWFELVKPAGHAAAAKIINIQCLALLIQSVHAAPTSSGGAHELRSGQRTVQPGTRVDGDRH